MGNTCPSPPGGGDESGSGSDNEKYKKYLDHQDRHYGESQHNDKHRRHKLNKQLYNNNSSGENLRAHQMDELMRKAQAHNLKTMREDIKTDLNSFILDNLLLCVQLFDNFDKVATEAKEFKRDIEKQISEKLSPLVNNGAIHGDRRCFLIHGMGHQLAKNYIYKDKAKKVNEETHYDEDSDNEYNSTSSEDEGVPEEKRTFICEGILPLEFILTWDNLEVYKENEWDGLKEYQYSAAKGMAQIARFCLEEPNEHNKIPKGYARLRCVDIPMSIRKGHDPLLGSTTPDDVYYSRASDFTGVISEVGTDSDIHSEDDVLDRHPTDNKPNSNSRSRWANAPYPKNFGGIPNLHPAGNRNVVISPISQKRMPLHGTARPIRSNQMGRIAASRSEPNLPEVIISPGSESATSSVSNRTPLPSPLPVPKKSNLRMPQPSQSQLPSTATPVVLNKRLSKSVPKLTSNGAPKGNVPSEYGGVRSRSSSIASEDVRQKWRQVEVKNLGQFPNLTRQYTASEPIHQSCYMPFKVEIDSDDEGNKFSSSDSDSDSESSDDSYEENVNPMRKIRISTGKKSKKKRKDSDDDESKFELRFYLNSSAVSSDFCSEFNHIGQKIGIGEGVLNEAIVLGTTVRCSIPYPNGLGPVGPSRRNRPEERGGHYKVLYTFTPSLHSKAWPQRSWARIAWAEKMRAKKGPDMLRWPHPHQVETLELAGCNVIPLGFRSLHSTQSDHVIQPFNWQVGFANPENILLNSFRNVHWRCYIMGALLFRAFIAPLGPLGIGLEHIRNIMYEMCSMEFHNWTEEKPGSQLDYLLKRLYDSLSHSQLYNFFVEDFNMLRNVPSPNLRKVQAYLKPVSDNLIIHCIYAFRNLRTNRTDFYPTPNFKQLYEILITKEKGELITLGLEIQGFASQRRPVNTKGSRKKKKNQRKKAAQQMQNLVQAGELMGDEFGNPVEKKDKQKEKALKARAKYEADERRKHRQERKAIRAKEKAEATPSERRSSIDVTKTPERSLTTTPFRLPLIVKFFIRHFINMARKSMEFSAYAQTAMYILHVENLCHILQEEMNERENAAQFLEDVKYLRDTMGAENMREYVRSKYPHLEETKEPLDEVSMLNLTSQNHSNNWVLSAENRKLPPVPGSSRRVTPTRIPSLSRNMAKSLQSIPAITKTPILPEDNVEEDIDFEALGIMPLPIPRAHGHAHAARRTKFVQKPYFSNKPSFIQGPFFSRSEGPVSPPILYHKNLPEYKSYLPEGSPRPNIVKNKLTKLNQQ